MTKYRGVLLDVDGTLIDSNDAHAASWTDVLREAGMSIPQERLRWLIGMGSDKLLAEAADIDHESEQGKVLAERRKQVFRERYLPRLEAFPGSRALVERMRAEGLDVVVASSAGGDELGPLLEVAGIADLVQHATSSSDAERSKPDPDIVVAAVQQSRFPASELVMLGDTRYDIEAAARAGVDAIGVLCGGWSAEALRGAIAIYQGPADLLAHYDESSLGQ